MKNIGVIGLGDMGSGIALNLIKDGFKVFGSDLLPARQEAFKKMGGSLEISISDIGKKCDAVFVMVMNGSQAKSIIFDEGGLAKNMEKGSTVNSAALVAAGVIRRELDGVRVLAKGELKEKLDFDVAGMSKAATEAGERLGGKVTVTAPVKTEVASDEPAGDDG